MTIVTPSVPEFKEAFNIFDSNGGGTISHGELGTVMRSLGQNPTEKDLEEMIKEVDQDGNGEIDFEEFLLLMVKTMSKADDDDELKRAFKIFDVDNSGTISASDLRLIMECLGEKLTDEEVKTMIEIADDDRDGEVSLNEAFLLFDKNKDGTIDREELRDVLMALGMDTTTTEVQDFINDIDVNEKKGMRELDAQEELMAAFKVFDTDGNGYINVDEFKYAMTNLGEKFSDADIEDMINKFDIDKDGRLNYSEMKDTFNFFDQNGDGTIDCKELGAVMHDGKINFDEFFTFMAGRKTVNKTEAQHALTEAFKVFDKNGDGHITKSELAEAMTTLGEKLSEKDVEDLIKTFDIDGDGTLNIDGSGALELDEFIDMMHELQSQETGNLKEQADQLEQAFDAIDTDDNNALTREELVAALVGVGDDDFTEKDVDEMIRMCDTNNDEYKEAFTLYDANENGTIRTKDLATVMD
ncbi:hypothetical protein KUTeg_014211 [Tegillarca granosa]|uniref:EF-hand domain-containing protein n=1 Tax=Tegillarca granosa TaxID=220873 RepID=A0ABQ9EVZ5_TEGGR|nr:hypothetical protein KUTeg_014211 [Tegillarca granosa]